MAKDKDIKGKQPATGNDKNASAKGNENSKAEETGAAKKKSKKRLMIIVGAAVLLVIILIAGYSYYKHKEEQKDQAPAFSEEIIKPVYIPVPPVITNLNAPFGQEAYVKLQVDLETAPVYAAAVKAAMPQVINLIQTYLRDMRPSELMGSEGTYRLREELISRINLAIAPAKVINVLFQELLVQ